MNSRELRRPADDLRATRPRDLSRAAFSLVELVIVLAILAMLAAIAVPRYGQAQARYRADAAAQRIALDLQRARDSARATSAAQTFLLSGTTKYSFGPGAGTAQIVDLAQEPYGVITVGGTLGTQSIQFDGFGKPAAGTAFFVGTGNEWRRIDIASDGQIKISLATRVQAGVATAAVVSADSGGFAGDVETKP